MKIVYQYLEVNGWLEFFPIFSTITLMLGFIGIIFYAMKVSKKFADKMSSLPLDNEENDLT